MLIYSRNIFTDTAQNTIPDLGMPAELTNKSNHHTTDTCELGDSGSLWQGTHHRRKARQQGSEAPQSGQASVRAQPGVLTQEVRGYQNVHYLGHTDSTAQVMAWKEHEGPSTIHFVSLVLACGLFSG